MFPSEQDRQACLCQKHDNLDLMVHALHKANVLTTTNTADMVNSISCDHKRKECAYDQCDECVQQTCPFIDKEKVNTEEIEYQQWVSKGVTQNADDHEISFRVISKDILRMKCDMLVNQFESRLHVFKKHVFNIRNQYQAYKNIRENLCSAEALIHIDISENYACKYSAEVQSMHFGASHQQASLHTGVLYVRLADESSSKTLPFCSISASRRHDPPGIWAHLDPVLDWLCDEFPSVTTLHIFSDGPTTQYRQKANFYLLSTIPFQRGFTAITWHFFEAGHGKGAPDGVGGSLKRAADRVLKLGGDIPNATALYQTLLKGGTSVRLFFIEEDEMHKFATMLPQEMKAVKGTMKIHQIMTKTPGAIMFRDVSCICRRNGDIVDCDCFGVQSFSFQTTRPARLDDADEVEENVPLRSDDSDHATVTSITAEISQVKVSCPDVISETHTTKWCVVKYTNLKTGTVVVSRCRW